MKRLRGDCGVDHCVIVEVIFDDQIALARGLCEPREVEDADFSASVFDKSFSLKNPGCRRDSGTATPEHICEKPMRNLKRVDVRAVRTDEAARAQWNLTFRENPIPFSMRQARDA